MTFDEAYAQMRAGAAIARPNWKKIVFLFWARENVWVYYKSGKVSPLWMFNGALSEATDWFVVQVENLPTIPESKPKPQPTQTRRTLLSRLARKQELMRQRHGGK
jgi:hypothetical protein